MRKGGTVAIRKAVLALVGCLALAGCSAANFGTEIPTPTVIIPSQGQSLSEAGFTNGPGDLVWLPQGIRLEYAADQPNLLIAVGDSSQAPEVEDYLRQTLPGLGWRITADAGGGLMFEQGEWHGAYALGTDSWALTVRND